MFSTSHTAPMRKIDGCDNAHRDDLGQRFGHQSLAPPGPRQDVAEFQPVPVGLAQVQAAADHAVLAPLHDDRSVPRWGGVSRQLRM